MIAVLAQQAADVAAVAESGTAEFWVFWILAPISLGAALSMVLLKHPVHAALMLVVNFFTIAVFYAVLEAQLIAVLQIIVYAGAIMVLFLFVLMLLGVDREVETRPSRLKGQGMAAVLVGIAVLLGLIGAVASPFLGTESTCTRNAVVAEAATAAGADAQRCAGLTDLNNAEGGNVRGVGSLLFTDYVWPFEVTSVLLVVAAIGAMVLGKRRDDPRELVDVGVATLPARSPARAARDAAAEGDVPGGGLVERPVPVTEGPTPRRDVLQPDDGTDDAGGEP